MCQKRVVNSVDDELVGFCSQRLVVNDVDDDLGGFCVSKARRFVNLMAG